jgi:MFS family permease
MEPKKKRMLAAVCMYHAFNDGSLVILPALFPLLYTQKFLITRYSDIGTMVLIGLAVSVIAQALIGHFSKPRHSRYYLAVDALIVGISLLLLTLSRNYMMLVLFFIGIRLGTSIYHPVGFSWISHSFKGPSLDRAMGMQSAFGNIGVLLAFTSTGFLAEHYGWKTPLYVWGSINLAAVIAGFAISAGTTSKEEIAEQKESEKKPISWPHTFRGVAIFIPLILFGGLAWGIMLDYSPSLLNHRLGMPPSMMGMVLGLWMAAGTLSALFYGRIAERFNRRRTLMASYVVMAASSLTLAFGTSAPLVIAAFALSGLGLFITYPSIPSFMSEIIRDRERTAAFALSANISIVGNSVFSFISGHISDMFSIQAPFVLLSAMVILVIFYLRHLIRSGRISGV